VGRAILPAAGFSRLLESLHFLGRRRRRGVVLPASQEQVPPGAAFVCQPGDLDFFTACDRA